ncbi:thiosulfate oxidation carrier complex protein SoxZ [Halomonas campisalis]|uniref:Thiosulfate oxidation carrier complex protein SoxZ n=1 Tax=Billgrantia campisalis TaxID=74661 RepID=A0ABS9P8V5_9GAMM|nr:thiosulfate oxidation carrier complex protein SoxZ [Halomonas campisalis]MCG6658210.1 thiosulfate oxidation carrier complex protein SoxZ [Halomonas campisalis]MDR5862878.1 thiosulfate oxidation carrier complex protein SoxZ [Halomonas campisalis]
MRSTPASPPDALRRRLLRGLATAILGVGLLGLSLPALADGPWQRLDAARSVLGDTPPHTEGLVLDLPLVSEDGSAVALTVGFEGRLAEGDYIERIDLFASDNPSPEIASFHLTPMSGKPEISTRVRLNETQRVIAIATSRQGEQFATAREVRVTVSGCLMRGDDAPPEPLSNARVSVPSRFTAGQPEEVRTLINHPMETGLREGANGETLPRHIVERFRVSLNGETAFEAELHQSISANPYLRFHLSPEAGGEAVFEWRDDRGESARHEASFELG